MHQALAHSAKEAAHTVHIVYIQEHLHIKSTLLSWKLHLVMSGKCRSLHWAVTVSGSLNRHLTLPPFSTYRQHP